MDEDKLLKELRAQRELIEKHLQWIDRKIAALDHKEAESTTAGDKAATKHQSSAHAEVVVAEQQSDTSPTDQEEDEADEEFGRYKAPTGNEIQRAKIGCLVLFVLSSLLFLFLLFGLPYLMDW